MAEKQEMSFLEHLEELRWLIIRSLVAIAVGAVLAFLFKEIIFDTILFAPKNSSFITNRLLCALATKLHMPSICINQHNFQLISINMSGQFNMHMFVSGIAGLVLAFPYICWELWRFISPALREKERNYARGAIFYISFLFFVGILFGYFVISPFSVDFLGSYQVSEQVINQINLGSYIETVVMVTLASGLAFELPIIVYFLTSIGLLSPKFMRKYRRHSIVVILIIAAIITPPDVVSQTLVAIPLYLLYEASILISAAVYKRRNSE